MPADARYDIATKAAALADLAAGCTVRETGKRRGVPAGTVGRWAMEARQRNTMPKQEAGERARRTTGGGLDSSPSGRARAAGIIDLAAAPELARKLRRGAWGLAGLMELVGDAYEARLAAKEVRARLRAEGMSERDIDRECPLPDLPDMRQVDAGARALKTALEIAPGLATFDAETGGASDTGMDADERARMDAVMGIPAPVAARLRVVEALDG